MSNTKTPESTTTVRQHGDPVEGSGERVEECITSPRRPIDYNDDRQGMMRVHVAADRGDLAAKRYKMADLRAWAKAHGCDFRAGSLNKRDFAWYMAQDGLIDADGNLRDCFPGGAS